VGTLKFYALTLIVEMFNCFVIIAGSYCYLRPTQLSAVDITRIQRCTWVQVQLILLPIVKCMQIIDEVGHWATVANPKPQNPNCKLPSVQFDIFIHLSTQQKKQ